MPFTMSGNNDGWSFNRFDEYEAKLSGEQQEEVSEEVEQIDERLDEMPAGDVGHEIHKKAMKANQSAVDAVNRTKDKKKLKEEEDIILDEDSRRMSNKQHTARVKSNINSFGDNYTPPSNYDPDANRGQGEVLTPKQIEKKRRKELRQEGIDFKGAKRVDDARAKVQAEKDKKNPSGKDRRLAMGKFRPGASNDERAEGHRDNMREKGTSPVKDGKKMFEALKATGLFSAEEIEELVEASCGSKGYQEGGEVKDDKEDCDKCKGKGCDHCGDKKKSDKKDSKKPDYIDADKDGDKEEPMEKALKEKGDKKEDPIVAEAVAALGALLGKAGAAAKGAAGAAKAAGATKVGSAVKGMAKDAALDVAKGAASSVANSVGNTARKTVSDGEPD